MIAIRNLSLFGVLLLTFIIGVGSAYVVSFYKFPGVNFFKWALIESNSQDFKSGDEVVLTGCRVGEIYPGGYSQIVKVNSELLVKKPKEITNLINKISSSVTM